jgi:hypothetical protein
MRGTCGRQSGAAKRINVVVMPINGRHQTQRRQNANSSRRMKWDIEAIKVNELPNIEGKTKGKVRIAG